MALTKLKATRTEETREATSKNETYSFEEKSALDIPENVLERFHSQGMALRWIRISLDGEDDYKNVGKQQRVGWTFVSPEEVPELANSSFTKDEGRYKGVVSNGDVALAKMLKGKVEAMTEYYRNKHKAQEQAVEKNLQAASDSKMPITNSSKSSTTRGREPRFQR